MDKKPLFGYFKKFNGGFSNHYKTYLLGNLRIDQNNLKFCHLRDKIRGGHFKQFCSAKDEINVAYDFWQYDTS